MAKRETVRLNRYRLLDIIVRNSSGLAGERTLLRSYFSGFTNHTTRFVSSLAAGHASKQSLPF